MAEALVLEGEPRKGSGSQAATRLRREGKVPAVLYGHKEETLSLSLPMDELAKAIRHSVRIVNLKANGKTESAFIQEVQWDHLGKQLLHVDFKRVSMDERIVVTVPLEVRGTAPGVTAGGVLDQPMHTLSIECLALRIPENIRVTIGELQLGASIHVKDLTLPEGVKAMTDPEAIVVHVTVPAAAPEAPAAAEVVEKAEPEVITQKKAEEESE